MLFRKKKSEPKYDITGKVPTIRASICTGEQVAGLKDPVTGKFSEIMLIRDSRDLLEFCEGCGITEKEIKREW